MESTPITCYFGLLLLIVASAAATTPRNISVSNSAQLTSALKEALPGDFILLAVGFYEGPFTASQNGSKESPIMIEGVENENGTAHITGGPSLPALTLSGSHYILTNLTLHTQDAVGLLISGENVQTIELRTQAVYPLSSGMDAGIVTGNNAGLKLSSIGNARFAAWCDTVLIKEKGKCPVVIPKGPMYDQCVMSRQLFTGKFAV